MMAAFNFILALPSDVVITILNEWIGCELSKVQGLVPLERAIGQHRATWQVYLSYCPMITYCKYISRCIQRFYTDQVLSWMDEKRNFVLDDINMQLSSLLCLHNHPLKQKTKIEKLLVFVDGGYDSAEDVSSAVSIFSALLQQLSGLTEITGYLLWEDLHLIGSLIVDIVTSSGLFKLKKIDLEFLHVNSVPETVSWDPLKVGNFPYLEELTLQCSAITIPVEVLYQTCLRFPSLKSLSIGVAEDEDDNDLPGVELASIMSQWAAVDLPMPLLIKLKLAECPLAHMRRLLTLIPLCIESLHLHPTQGKNLPPQQPFPMDNIVSYISKSYCNKLQSLVLYDICCSSVVFTQLISNCAQCTLAKLYICFAPFRYTPSDLQSIMACLRMLAPSLKELSVKYPAMHSNHLIDLLFNQTTATDDTDIRYQPSFTCLSSIEIHFLDISNTIHDNVHILLLIKLILEYYSSQLIAIKFKNYTTAFLDALLVQEEEMNDHNHHHSLFISSNSNNNNNNKQKTQSVNFTCATTITLTKHLEKMTQFLVNRFTHLVTLQLGNMILPLLSLQALQDGYRLLNSLHMNYPLSLDDVPDAILQLSTKQPWYSLTKLTLIKVVNMDVDSLKGFIAVNRRKEYMRRPTSILASSNDACQSLQNQPTKLKNLQVTLIHCGQKMDNDNNIPLEGKEIKKYIQEVGQDGQGLSRVDITIIKQRAST